MGLLTLIAGVVQKRGQVGFGAEGVAGGQRQPRRDGVRPALPLGATTFRLLNGAEQLHGRARMGPSTTGLHQILNARMMIGWTASGPTTTIARSPSVLPSERSAALYHTHRDASGP
jgi:hypothetical protein